MKRIVIINGTGGSGKNTFIDFCSRYAKVYDFSSVDKVKEIARAIGWNGQKEEKDRKFLSDLKKLTTEYNDMAFNSIKDAVNKFYDSENEIMFIHIREPEEIERAVKTFSAYSLLIKRDGVQNISSNYSDANVDNYDYDYIIKNITLDDFNKRAEEFVKNIINIGEA